MPFRSDYEERVYAGVLGKIIGVYLGRPFEGWPYRSILEKLGPIEYYVHDRLGQPLIVTDDDISGTFTFLRALEDSGCDPNLTSEQIGKTWLNLIIEDKSILWWGGMGVSTEHTAFLRLKSGVPAPASGSMALNGQVVSEQIGAQIFIDGWGMVCPGDPGKAAGLAARAARVSHDGEAVYGAQVVAALVATGFEAPPFDEFLEQGLAVIPKDCLIRRLVDDVRGWHAKFDDWQDAFLQLERHYGYDTYCGGCHMVPNHGLIWLALLYGQGDFGRSQMIVNTGGWDTDCNAGNVGAILGVYGSLAGLEAGGDFRGPVADRMYLPTADSGRCVTDALTEAQAIVRMARRLNGCGYEPPKGGARFHFSQPGAVQGFQGYGEGRLANPDGNALRLEAAGLPFRATTPTFLPVQGRQQGGYANSGSPIVYPGQTVCSTVEGARENAGPVGVRLVAKVYADSEAAEWIASESLTLAPGESATIRLPIPAGSSAIVEEVGLEVVEGTGTVLLDRLAFEGCPDVAFDRHAQGMLWLEQWVQACSAVHALPFRVIQNEGRGFLITGCRDWADYRVWTTARPHMAGGFGLAGRWQGLRRYVSLWWEAGSLKLLALHDEPFVLAEVPMPWTWDEERTMVLELRGRSVEGRVGEVALRAELPADILTDGGIALGAEDGNCFFGPVRVGPLTGGF